MTRKKILHLFNAFQVGGVERQHMMLVQELASHSAQACWSYNEGAIQAELDALGIEHRVGRFETVIQWLKEEQFDCVVSRTNRYMREMYDHFTEHPIPLVYIRSFLRWFEGNKTYFDAELEELSYSIADFTFFSGPSLMESANTLAIEIPGNMMLYNGLYLDRFPMVPHRLGDIGPIRLGILANLAPHKNQLTAIRVLANHLKSGRCSLTLGGDAHFPAYAEEISRAVQDLPVELKGFVPDPVTFYKGIDIALLSSTHEGWPIALMEAMACGLPVIAPAVGDIEILLNQGSAGLLYPAGDFKKIPELVETLTDRKVYEKYSKAAVERVKDFDIKRAGAKLQDAIEQVTKTSKGNTQSCAV